MAGYEYRGADSRRRRAEEFARRRDAAEAARKLRTARPKKRPAEPKETTVPDLKLDATIKPLVDAPHGEFAIVKEEPPPIAGAEVGAVAAAARDAITVLKASPGEWFRVARRKSRSSAASYAGTLRKYDKTIQTRNVADGDGVSGLLYARSNPDLTGTARGRRTKP